MDYEVKITYSSFDLTSKDKLKAMSFGGAEQLYDATAQAPLAIDYKGYVEVEVHNEVADNKDYKKYIVYDKRGGTYITGSESFIKEMRIVVEAMKDETEEWFLKVFQLPSKNYNGRKFLTCTVE